LPIVILILTAIGGAIWWWVRNKPREALNTAHDVATTLKNAPRKLAFRSVANAHPVEGIDDERIAICAIAQAFLELDDLPTAEQRQRLHILIRKNLRFTEEEASEMEVLGRWLVTQCNGPVEAVPRLGRRLRKLDTGQSWDRLQEILMPLAGEQLSRPQVEAISDLKVALRIS